MRALVILVVLAPVARADGKQPAVTANERTCKKLVDEARALAAKTKLKDAIAKLEACVKLIPDEPTALGELGYTAFRAKDLAKAEQATRKALATQAAPHLRGAILYNLGQILEGKVDKPGAIAAYTQSLQVRPDGTVRARLRTLDAKAAAAFDPYKPVAMAGPFPSIDAYCKARPTQAKDDFGEVHPCTCGTRVATGKPLAAPYQHVDVVLRTCASNGHKDGSYGTDAYELAVQVAAGWYVAPIEALRFARHCDNDAKFPVLGVKDLVAGGEPEATVELAYTGECRKAGFWDSRALVVVGVGPSGVPSATPAIPIKHHEETYVTDADGVRGGTSKLAQDVALKVTWKPDGTLEVTGKTTGLDKAAAGDLLGTHALPFP